MQEFGVDVGSTKCVISTIKDGEVETLDSVCPNVCIFDGKHREYRKSNKCVTSSGDSLIRLSKRNADLKKESRMIFDGTIIEFYPEQMLSLFFEKCIDIIGSSKYGGSKQIPVSIAVPNHFDRALRSVYANAVSLLPELSLQSIVNESTALAVAYGVQVYNIIDVPCMEKYVLFVDSGCQTTVTLAMYSNDLIKILFTAHNPFVSGDMIDDLVYSDLLNELTENNLITTPTYKQKQQLMAYSEQIKISLNKNDTTELTVFLDKIDNIQPYTIEYTRARLNKLIGDTNVDKFLIDLIWTVINGCGVNDFSFDKLSRIVLFGGNMKLLILSDKIKKTFKCEIDTEWNNYNRISEGLMHYMYKNNNFRVEEDLPLPSILDLIGFNCDFLKVSKFVKCYNFEMLLRAEEQSGKFTRRRKSLYEQFLGLDNEPEENIDYGSYRKQTKIKKQDNQIPSKLEARIVTIDTTVTEERIKAMEEILQQDNEEQEAIIKESPILNQLSTLKNSVYHRKDEPKKSKTEFLFDSVFSESYKDTTGLSNDLVEKGDIYENSEEYQKQKLERDLKDQEEREDMVVPLLPKKEKVLKLPQSVAQRIIANLNTSFAIKKNKTYQLKPKTKVRRAEEPEVVAEEPKPKSTIMENESFEHFMERLERIQSDYYSASKLIDLTRFLATYKEISQLERCNHEKLMKIIIHDLANNFFVLSYAMLSQLRGDALVEGVIDYIRGVKGYKGRITNFYMKISGYSIRERISQIEQFISQNPSIKREYKKNNGVKK